MQLTISDLFLLIILFSGITLLLMLPDILKLLKQIGDTEFNIFSFSWYLKSPLLVTSLTLCYLMYLQPPSIKVKSYEIIKIQKCKQNYPEALFNCS